MTRTRQDILNTLAQFRQAPLGQLLIGLFEKGSEERIPSVDGGEPEPTFAIAAQVVLKSGHATAGAFTVEESGVLRMAQPGFVQNPNAKTAPAVPILANHYFQLHDVEIIILVDKMVTEKSRIHMG